MPIFNKPLPLSLYIHLPWCVRKCPYCDFNSHTAKQILPEDLYVAALLSQLDTHLDLIAKRPLISIFFGGGTPSLFSAKAIAAILQGVAKRCCFDPHIEITLEANPGTVDEARFRDFHHAGVNRLSLGIQSLQDKQLHLLGRIHSAQDAIRAIDAAYTAGFSNINLDLMHGLPEQSVADAINDIEQALQFEPKHLSWYQLTIEENTLFHYQRPILPDEHILSEIQCAGFERLSAAHLRQYEVSAFAKNNYQCQHNRNYWEFGDYLGLGAGAHSKLSDHAAATIMRFSQVKHPNDYLSPIKRQPQDQHLLGTKELLFEFMLNALRLTDGIPLPLFSERTGLEIEILMPLLLQAQQRELLFLTTDRIVASDLGKRFLNDTVAIFLEAPLSFP
jgi:putative oxygen-independent coproporphyrinogen III oxidase